MRRFLAFKGELYGERYGGWVEFVEDFDALPDAVVAVSDIKHDQWWHVVDVETGEIVAANDPRLFERPR